MKKRIAFACMLALFIFAALTYFARAQSPVSITITSSPATGVDFVEVDSAPVTTPTTPFSWTTNDTHTLFALSPVSGGTGTQYVFTSWSAPSFGSSTSQTYTYTVPSSDETVTATYQTQYLVTFSSSGLGADASGNLVGFSVTGGSYSGATSPIGVSGGFIWVDSGASVGYSFVTPVSSTNTGEQYRLDSVNGATSPITVSGANTLTGVYVTQYEVSFTATGLDSDAGSNTVLTLGGTPYTYNALPSSVYVNSDTTFSWTATVSGGSGKQFVETGSSGASPITAAGTYSATYKTQWSVTFQQSGLGSDASGTVLTVGSSTYTYSTLPSSAIWVDDGTTFSYTSPVPAGSGKQYVSTGVTGVSSPVHSSGTVTGSYNTQYQHTITSSPATGSGYVNVDGGAVATSYPTWWDSGSPHTIAANSPVTLVSGQSQYIYSRWSDSGAQSHSVSPTAVTTYTAVFQLQYYFNVSSAYDNQTGAGWYNAGSSVSSTITRPVSGGTGIQYETTGWTGTGSLSSGGSVGSSSTVSFTLNAYTTCTWNWKTQYYLTVTSAYGATSGQGWYDSGSTAYATVTPLTVAGPTGTQYVFTQWAGGASGTASPSNAITMSSPMTATATWTTQYLLTVSSAYDSPSPISGWFDSGSSVTESVTSPTPGSSGTQYVVTGWTGTGSVSSSGSGATVTFTIAQPSSITWNWKTQYYLTVSSPFDSPTPLSGWFDSGSSITESVTSPVSGDSGIQYVCTGWTGTGSVPSSGGSSAVTFTITGASSITWNWQVVQRSLTVYSAHDSPNPANGVYYFNDGSYVTVSVSSPVTESGTVWTCTGWTGTGSVPSSGTDSSVSFTIAQDSSITWNWHGNAPQHNLTVSSAHGNPSPAVGNHPYDQGDNVTCSVTSPVTENDVTYVCTGWSGAGSVPSTGSDTVVNFTILQDSSITWNWQVAQWTLTVVSPYGSPSPAVGEYIYNDGASVTCNVSSPVVEAGVSYTCTGWSGTGSVPSSGTGTSVTFTISLNSTITWNWAVTQWALTVSSAHDTPNPGVGDTYYADGSSVTCNVSSPVVEGGVSYTCMGWLGTGSVPSNGSDISVTFSIAENSSITWNWVVTLSVQWALTVVSAHGNPDPAVGDHLYNDGASVTCNVSSPVIEAGVSYTCIGWNGTGSAPSGGSDISVTFTMTENSSITWNWVVTPSVQWTLTVLSAQGSPNPAVGDHLYTDGSSVVCSVSSPVVETGVSYTCIGWNGTGSVQSGGSGTSTTFTITENSSITWDWQVQPAPTIGSCDNTGVQKNIFTSDGAVYVTGAGYAKNQTFSIYVVDETTWVDGMAFPERVQGTATSVSSDSSGNIHTTVVWTEPLTSGNYDILVDVNGNGKYDAQVDAFYSIQVVTSAESFLMPEYVFGTILGLAGCFAALGAFLVYERKRR